MSKSGLWLKQFLLFCSLLFGGPAFQCGSAEDPAETVSIGVLLSETGDGASTAAGVKAALDLALSEINPFLSEMGSPLTLQLVYEDTQTDPATALLKAQSLVARGINWIIGPYSSAEALTLKDYLQTTSLVMISPSVEAAALAIPNDAFFRFTPSNAKQAVALSALLARDNIRVLVPLVRDDLWGNDLYGMVNLVFSGAGRTVLSPIQYSPELSDFSDPVSQLNAKLQQALTTYSPEETAVYVVSFAEGADIMALAKEYTELSAVSWYGGSALAMADTVTADSAVAEFALGRKLQCPTFAFDEDAQAKYEPLQQAINSVIGRDADIFAFAAYDALWVSALTFLATGTTKDFGRLTKALSLIAGDYYGATGWTVLDENGDRALANFDFWGLTDAAGQYSWIRTALYHAAADEIIRF